MEYKLLKTKKEKERIRELLKELMDFHAAIDCFYETPENFEPGEIIVCAEESTRVVGVIVGTFRKNIPDRNKDYAYISSIYVLSQYRKRGIAKELFLRFKELAKKQGIERIEMSADIRNKDSMAFWVKMGFEAYQYRMFLEF